MAKNSKKQHGVRLGFMSFYIKAVVEALKRYPEINASIDGDDVVYHNYFDISIAVSTPRGLVTPVLRDCDKMSMADIEKKIKELAEKGRDGKLTVEDLTGGKLYHHQRRGIRFINVHPNYQPATKCDFGYARY